jgi:hypothetical protein
MEAKGAFCVSSVVPRNLDALRKGRFELSLMTRLLDHENKVGPPLVSKK